MMMDYELWIMDGVGVTRYAVCGPNPTSQPINQ
jgi:hypothetical protein